MEKQNITLSLSKDLLLKVKHLAIDQNTSVSGLLTQTLKEIVRKDEDYKLAKERQMKLMETGIAMEIQDQKGWQREERYDRK